MALKYFGEYNDVVNVTHRFELYDDSFSGTSTEINGHVYLDYGSIDKVYECIRGCGLRVVLDADSTLTFSDLFTEQERVIKVIYIRDSITKFVGWLNPEGWYEDFVNDKWQVSFDAVDGLSYLSDLSYVDSSGLFFTGKQTELEVIVNALKRTNLDLNINIEIDIEYSSLGTSVNVLDNVYVNTQRFIKDDGDTIMDCKKVIESVLSKYVACITMRNGEWYIFKPNQLASSATYTGYCYDSDGIALSPATAVLDTSFSLGSQIDSYYPHHAGGNQSISNEKSIGALRVNWKYGFTKSFYDNNTFCSDDGTTLDDWTIDPTNSSYLTLTSGGCGAELDIVSTDLIILSNTTSTLDEGITLNFYIKIQPTGIITLCNFSYKITCAGSYFLMANGEWSTTDTTIQSEDIEDPSKIYTFNFTTQPLPASGDVLIYIYLPKVPSTPPTPSGTLNLIEFSMTNEDQGGGIKKGENHTFQRTDNPSSNVDNTIEVITGDSDVDAYYGTLYKNNEVTTTSTWNRYGVSESLPIIRLMGEEILRLRQSTSKLFSGDIYGYFDYLSTVTINNISGTFILIEYSYDTMNNLISAKFAQIHTGELTDIDYLFTYDYGNVVKPTIRG